MPIVSKTTRVRTQIAAELTVFELVSVHDKGVSAYGFKALFELFKYLQVRVLFLVQMLGNGN